MSYKTLLNDEIETEFSELKKIQVGSDEYKAAVAGLTTLMEKDLEIKKFEAECKEKDTNSKDTRELQEKQFESEHRDRIVKNAIAVVGIVLPLAVTIWGTVKSFEFEEEGTLTTIMGRGFIQKLLPKK